MSNQEGMDEFDRWVDLANTQNAPAHLTQAWVNIHDTLYAACKSARTCFGKNAKPEHALQICEWMLNEISDLDPEKVSGSPKPMVKTTEDLRSEECLDEEDDYTDDEESPFGDDD